jgi:hypothetical protein
MEFTREFLERALEALGLTLQERGLRFELVAVGGSGLMLLGVLTRPTRDLDIVAAVEDGRYVSPDPLPAELAEAQADVGRALGLGEDWLNAGPADLLRLGLPDGFEQRVTTLEWGGLILHVAGRFDQICFKLYAAVDQGPTSKHFDDLQRLAPTDRELLTAARWTRTHDPSDGFRDSLVRTLERLGVEVGDGDL